MSDIVSKLRDFQTRDHDRGCTGREYVCSCGYDKEIESALKEAAETIERLTTERDNARREALEAAAEIADQKADELYGRSGEGTAERIAAAIRAMKGERG